MNNLVVVCCDRNSVILQWKDAMRSGFIHQLLDGCTEISEEGVHLVDSSCTSDNLNRIKSFLEGDRESLGEWWKTKASEQDKLKILECANFLDVRELLSYLAVLPRSLHMPCVHGRADLIRALVEHKANPMVRAKYGAFLYLQVAKEEACLREITRAIRLREGWTELMLAASEGRKEFSELLLSQCLEPLVFVCVRNKDGKTALHYAAEFGCPEVINLLIERRANVGADDLNGWTALHCAASHGREGAVIALSNAGANMNAKTKLKSETHEEVTPLYLAAKGGHASTARLLIELNAAINEMNKVILYSQPSIRTPSTDRSQTDLWLQMLSPA